ncbi:MAG: hypothetical protein H7Z72_19735 [Bacteroidetes bacterium]|nr:hypothetical protein [Fibrella sp.]
MRALFSRKTGWRLVALLLSGLYVLSFMPSTVQNLVMARHRLPAWNPLASDKLRFGDLYGISFLSAFRLPYQNQATRVGPAEGGARYSVRLLGDSYMAVSRIRTAAFSGADTLTLGGIDEVLMGKSTVPPVDSRSILVLESTERLMRYRFGADTAVATAVDPEANLPWLQQQTLRLIRGFCRNPSTDLEYMVFDYGLFRPLKETRADLTYRWFGRISDGVGLAADGQRLYLKETIDDDKHSAFTRLDSAEVRLMVDKLNRVGQLARQQGYRAVFLSIVPNPVSVIEPGRGPYNHLVERVEQHPDLKLGVISLYDRFRADGRRYYHPSDSHWNQAGVDAWVLTMNQLFNRTARSDAF